MRWTLSSFLSLGLALLPLAAADAQPPLQKHVAKSWAGCCGLAPWAEPGPLKAEPRNTAGPISSGYAYIVGGSPLRHHLGLTGQIPAEYARLRNPLAPTPENAQRGAAVYEKACASCHGATGLGDGPSAHDVEPGPAHLGWLAKVPPSRRDAFIYWSTAEGGTLFKTAMPAYKGKLTDEEIWSVIGYIEARLPAPRTTKTSR